MYRNLLLITFCFLLIACGDNNPDNQTNKTNNNEPTILPQAQEEFDTVSASPETKTLINSLNSRSAIVFDLLKTSTQKLVIASEALTKAPTRENLLITRQYWKQAHDAYLSTRLFRQLVHALNIHHPVLDLTQTTPNLHHSSHTRIDQHPILSGYLDKVEGYPFSGLVHSEIELSEEMLHEEHLLGDPAYATLGFHPLEFILHGNEGLVRSIDDLIIKEDGTEEDKARKRRLQYIQLLSKILKEDIDALFNAWNTSNGFYFSALTLTPRSELRQSLQQISEVELEACGKIQAILEKTKHQKVHDSPESIEARMGLARDVLEILKNTNQS